MALREELEREGHLLFRWKSYLPLGVIFLFFIALKEFHCSHCHHEADRLWEIFCLGISLFGLGIRVLTIGYTGKGTSGRSTKKLVADELNKTGVYSVVRHPLYLGNFFIWLGGCLFVPSWWFAIMGALLFWLYYERIMFMEEEFLRKKFGDAFLKWAEKTPAFLPRFENYERATLSFSLRKVLKKEYAGFAGIIGFFTLLEIIKEKIVIGKFTLSREWFILFLFGLVFFVTLRILKKTTKVLNVPGR